MYSPELDQKKRLEDKPVGTGPSGGDSFYRKVDCFGEIEADVAARRGGNELRGYRVAGVGAI